MNAFSKFSVFVRVAVDQRYVASKRYCKISNQIVNATYFHVTLFRMHEKDTATKINFDTARQMN